MNLRDNIHEWIDSYLNGELNEGERTEFEALLKTDEEFSKTFEAHKISHQIVIGQELLNLKVQMSKDLSGKGHGGGSNNWKYFLTGATVITALIVLYFLFRSKEQVQMVEHKKYLPSDTITHLNDSSQTTSSVVEVKPQEQMEGNEKSTGHDIRHNHCSDTLISFSCQARASCMNENNGAIEVDVTTIKSGKAPFEFSVDPYNDFWSEGVIENLKPGRYNLYVKDASSCTRMLNVKVEIPVIDCSNKNK